MLSTRFDTHFLDHVYWLWHKSFKNDWTFSSKQDENDEDDIRLEDYVDRYFNDPNNTQKLQVLFSTSLSDACRRIAEYHDDDAANQIVEYENWNHWIIIFPPQLQIIFPFKLHSLSIKAACDFLNDKMPEDMDIDDALVEFHTTGEQVFNDIQKALSKRKTNSSGNVPFSLNDNGDDDDHDGNANEKENQTASKARGTRGGRSTTSKSTVASKPSASGRNTASRTTAAGPSARNGPNAAV